jgi:hypothetical protein
MLRFPTFATKRRPTRISAGIAARRQQAPRTVSRSIPHCFKSESNPAQRPGWRRLRRLADRDGRWRELCMASGTHFPALMQPFAAFVQEIRF